MQSSQRKCTAVCEVCYNKKKKKEKKKKKKKEKKKKKKKEKKKEKNVGSLRARLSNGALK